MYVYIPKGEDHVCGGRLLIFDVGDEEPKIDTGELLLQICNFM